MHIMERFGDRRHPRHDAMVMMTTMMKYYKLQLKTKHKFNYIYIFIHHEW